MNNQTDPISRASVLELLELETKRISNDESEVGAIVKLGIALELASLGYQIESLPSVSVSQPPETSLEKELESLPKNKRYIMDCKSNNSYVAFSYDFQRGDGSLVSGYGETPLEAVLKLKEALNSNR